MNPSPKLVDVRSPKEYLHAHIPGAVSLPLFSDEERAVVGTIYKQEGKERAIQQGLSFVGPKLASFVQQAQSFGTLQIYCARGGMRSEAMEWLLSFAKLPLKPRLEGGYKSYRSRVLEAFKRPYSLRVLTGYTGSGKTEKLRELQKAGEAVVDLEDLAGHKGSAFGFVRPQPSTEMFENLLAEALLKAPLNATLWVEDESRFIGTCKIPDHFYQQMQRAPLERLHRPLEERASRLAAEYGALPKEYLTAGALKIATRLGGARLKSLLSFIEQDRYYEAALLLLSYYDAAYNYSLKRRVF